MSFSVENLHHANIIFSPVSSFEEVVSHILKNISKEKIIEREFEHTDMIVFNAVTLGMDDVPMIVNFNSRKSLGKHKVMIISAQNITTPTQNALLKIFEEPFENTFFFLIVPSRSQILPTLLSRTREITLNLILKTSNNPTLDPENFIKHDVATRMGIIKEALSFLEKEIITRGQICEFISSVIVLRNAKSKIPKESLRAIVSIEHFMRDTASSMKMCLEYLALSV